jgi:hypothetical protein
MKWAEQAEIYYAKDPDNKRLKAIAAGKAMDNALKLEYTKGGTTNCHFMMTNWLAYFDYDVLGSERIKLMFNHKPK